MKAMRWAGMAAGVVLVMMAAKVVAEDVKVEADVSVGKKAGTTESMTVVQPGPGGETRILTKEVVTRETHVKQAVPAPVAPPALPDPAARKARVVVVPAVYAKDIRSKFQRELQEKWGMTDLGVIENPGYTSFIVDALVNTRKLDVLERETLEPVIKELDFGESDYADVNKVVKLGKMLNADYVVIPEIRYMSVWAAAKNVPYIGVQQKEVNAKLATNVRVVDVATARIVASNISDVGDKTRFKEKIGPEWQQMKDFIDGVYRKSGTAESAHIVDTAYPIKVVGVTDGVVTINRGKGAIIKGEQLNVYAAGEMMVDPDTKESLGFHEALMGKIRVIEVDEKTAKAEVLEGQGKIQKLFICRRDKNVADAMDQKQQPSAPKLD